MLQGWLQSMPLLFLPHMFPQLCGISLRCHSGFVTLPAIQRKKLRLGKFTSTWSLVVTWLTAEAGVGGWMFQGDVLTGRTTPAFRRVWEERILYEQTFTQWPWYNSVSAHRLPERQANEPISWCSSGGRRGNSSGSSTQGPQAGWRRSKPCIRTSPQTAARSNTL